MPAHRWKISNAELIVSAQATMNERLRAADPFERLGELSVMDALSSSLCFGFQTSERERVVEIAREVHHLGPLATIDYSDARQMVQVAVREGTLLALKTDDDTGREASGGATLIVYGDPPVAYLQKKDGSIDFKHPTFSGTITAWNRSSFERALAAELGKLVGRDLTGVRAYRLASMDQLRRLLAQKAYGLVIFYGHTITLNKTQQELVLATESRIFVGSDEWAHALKTANVRQTLIAGCESVAFAAGVTSAEPTIRAGGLRLIRNDDIVGNEHRITLFRIEPQPIKWWPN